MKKMVPVSVLAASLLAAVVLFVCTDVKFDNPLDKEGDNYLGGYMAGFDKKDEAKCFAKGDDGNPVFWNDTTCLPTCDPITPTIKLEGGNPIRINTLQVQEFRKWMHFDGGAWEDLITWTKGANGVKEPVPKEPLLSNNGVDTVRLSEQDKNKVPEAKSYVIIYRVEKPSCRGETPYAQIPRSLIVEQYVAADTGTPVISLGTNGETAQVTVGSVYTDRGATVTVNGITTPSALDSVVVKGPNNYRLKVEKPAGGTVDFALIKIPSDAAAGSTYTITFYASYKGASMTVAKVDQKTRTLTVLAGTASNVKPDIALKFFKHTWNGKTVYYPDTLVYVRSGVAYNNIEIGVDSVFYVSGGERKKLNVNLVTAGQVSPALSVLLSTGGTGTVTYELKAGEGYASTSAARRVFVGDRDFCDESGPLPPTVAKSGSDEIKAGEVWDYYGSWSVTNKDDKGGQGFKYLIDFNGLNPYNPVAGTYKITYVGRGFCGGEATLERTITVR